MKDHLKKLLPFLSFASLFVLLSILSPYFLTVSNLSTVARQTAVINIIAIVSTGENIVVASTPTPISPARTNDDGLEQVCHSGGCGLCSGRGNTSRSCTDQRALCQLKGVLHQALGSNEVASTRSAVASSSVI